MACYLSQECQRLGEQVTTLEQQLEELDRQHQAELEVALASRSQLADQLSQLQDRVQQADDNVKVRSGTVALRS